MMCSEDEEAVQQVVYSSDTNLADNGGDDSSNTSKEGETSDNQADKTPKKLTKQDIDNMTDDQVIA